jgi:cobalt transporter subunit CbtB
MTRANKTLGLISRLQAGTVPWTHVAGVTAAVLLGLVLVFGAGLAGSEVLHNAAHDLRHGMAFPCH